MTAGRSGAKLIAVIRKIIGNHMQPSLRNHQLQRHNSVDSFNFKHHKGRTELKPRILRLLDLDFRICCK